MPAHLIHAMSGVPFLLHCAQQMVFTELCLLFPLIAFLLCIHVFCSICVFSLYVCARVCVRACMCVCLGDCSTNLFLPSKNEGWDSPRLVPSEQIDMQSGLRQGKVAAWTNTLQPIQ